ncbi:class I glutamine amidotransferase-like protein [Mucidula mucida]|nr:class I glutamine amidotransferase-like protein [Mucidula mucida]
MSAVSSSPPRVLIPLSTNGHDPTEVAIPYAYFRASGLKVDFATPSGAPFVCDPRMLAGVTGALLGADAKAKQAYNDMLASPEAKAPLNWSDPAFNMLDYDLVLLPGGHEKGVKALIESEEIHQALTSFFPLTKRESGSGKVLAAICHGVQVLAYTPDPTVQGKSIIRACNTTALPAFMESGITTVTRPFLGDYYRTYGHDSPTVEEYVARTLDDVGQFKTGPGLWSGRVGQPFVVVEERYRYVSGRCPFDAEEVAKKAVAELKESGKFVS